jgi:hypothetical protein
MAAQNILKSSHFDLTKNQQRFSKYVNMKILIFIFVKIISLDEDEER